jgi:hypothetical protein
MKPNINVGLLGNCCIISKYAKDQAEEDLEHTEIVFDTERDIYCCIQDGRMKIEFMVVRFILGLKMVKFGFSVILRRKEVLNRRI